MTLADLWTLLEGLPTSQAIASGVLFPWIESLHVLALVVVVGAIAMVDLRLMGFRAGERGVRHLVREALPYTWIAFALALITGFLLFASSASTYAGNIAFRIKLCLLLLAGLNMLAFHLTTYRSVDLWDELTTPPWRARLAGAVSLGCWALVVAFGRWIGFVQ